MLCCGGSEEEAIAGPPSNQYTTPLKAGNAYSAAAGGTFLLYDLILYMYII